MANRFEIITSTLFFTEVGIERGISGSSRQIFTISERYVLTVRSSIKLGETKVNDIDKVFRLISASYEEVVRFDVTMQNALGVDTFYQPDHLDGGHASRAQIKLVLAVLKEVLHALSEQVHDHNMKLITTRLLVCSNVIQLWYIRYKKEYS